MKLVIRLSKLDYSNNSVRSASKNLKHHNMSALQQAYAFSETRLNEAQLMHPIVKTLLAIFDSIRGGLRQWIQTEEYKRCSEEVCLIHVDFVTRLWSSNDALICSSLYLYTRSWMLVNLHGILQGPASLVSITLLTFCESFSSLSLTMDCRLLSQLLSNRLIVLCKALISKPANR